MVCIETSVLIGSTMCVVVLVYLSRRHEHDSGLMSHFGKKEKGSAPSLFILYFPLTQERGRKVILFFYFRIPLFRLLDLGARDGMGLYFQPGEERAERERDGVIVSARMRSDGNCWRYAAACFLENFVDLGLRGALCTWQRPTSTTGT